MKKKIIMWLKSPIFRQERTLFLVWVLSAIIFAMVKLMIGKYNNYKIFHHLFDHAVNGLSLYIDYPAEYYDQNHYGPFFSFVIAPFSALPEWLGLVLWVVLNTVFLFYAIRQLPISQNHKIFIYWYSLCELMTAQGVQQFNISVAALIILSFAFVEQRKDFWAACVIMFGAFIKIYPLAGLAFFFFSKQKMKFVFSCGFWAVVFLSLPMLYTPGPQYVLSQYVEWFERLSVKNELNMFALSQNISLLGIVRKISGNAVYSNFWLMIPAFILFFIPYLRISQYKNLNFRLMLLANVLLFVVLFSSGSEASGYVTAMIGVALWYVSTPSIHKRCDRWLMIATLVIVGLSSTELVPSFIRNNVIAPYVVKAWLCSLVWFVICYRMICIDFASSSPTIPVDK